VQSLNATTTRDAVFQFTKAFLDRAGWNEASFDVYPGYQAPIVRVAEDGRREIARATWGMPSPPAYVKNYDPGVTNIRNVASPHWRRWLGATSRCVIPFTPFLTTPEEVETWLTSPWDEARLLQRPLPANMLVIVPPQSKPTLDDEGLLL
jgi:putative SOS response-associated peptidase YedK